MRKSLSALFLALAAWSVIGAATACSSKDDPQVDPKVEVSEVKLNQTSATLEVGGTVSLTATVSPSNATDKAVTWSTSNAGVATVSNGLVTAAGEGSATITAMAGGKSATCSVQVARKTVAVTGITLNESELNLYLGDSFQLEATVSPADATDKTVTWRSEDPALASIDQNGLVTAVNPGLCTVWAEHGDVAAKCVIHCCEKPKVTSIVFNKARYGVQIGKTVKLEYSYYPADAINTDFTWSVSNTEIATVDNTGTVTGKALGTVTVTATADNGVVGYVSVAVTVPGGNEDYDYEDLN